MSGRAQEADGTEQPHASRRGARDGDRGGRPGRPARWLVVLPTDTVYGVAADAFDPEAVAGLFEAKGRGREMPPPVLVSAATTLEALATTSRLRARPRGLLARPAHAGVPPADLVAVGPG